MKLLKMKTLKTLERRENEKNLKLHRKAARQRKALFGGVPNGNQLVASMGDR